MNKPVLVFKVPDKAVFSHREAARFVGQSPNTFTRTAREHKIPVYRRRGRKVYKLNDLEEYISSLPSYNRTCESLEERRSSECKKMAG